jgi:hypothetical protein
VVEVTLYLIERIGNTDYDEHAGFVIRADTAKKARKLAGTVPGSMSEADLWLDPTRSTCSILKHEGPEEVILEDYRAG